MRESADWLAVGFAGIVFFLAVGCHLTDDQGEVTDLAPTLAVDQTTESVRPDPEPTQGEVGSSYEPRRIESDLPAMSAADVVAEQRAAEESGATDLSDSPRMRIVEEQKAAEAGALQNSPRMRIVEEQKAAEAAKERSSGDKKSP